MDSQSLAEVDEALEETTTTQSNKDSSLATRPANVPEKFWDVDLGSVRIDALVKSYGELENKLGDPIDDIPETPDQYDLVIDHDAFGVDAEVNTRLHAAGFSQEQVQIVYDLAKEKLLPLIQDMSGSMEQEAETVRLVNHFGGQQNWRNISRQISHWGRKQLPPGAFDALSSSFEGVTAMHHMMTSGEPPVLGNQGRVSSGVTESDLKRMMHDPRYWRDQDPSFVGQVQQGFQTLYPE